MDINELILNVFHFRDQVHIWHWQTRNHSTHVTLGDFYEGLIDELDRLIEALLANNMQINAEEIEIPIFANFDIELVRAAFKQYLGYLEELHTQVKCSAVLNILDDMSESGNKVLFLLKFD
jgi:hypothetical protein